MVFNLCNFGTIQTKDNKEFYFIDVLCRDITSKKINVSRVFVNADVFSILARDITDDLEMFSYDINKYIAFGFNYKNEVSLNFYNELFLADNK